MKAVIQRVNRASVTVDANKISSIDKGLLILLGISKKEHTANMEKLADKIVNLRIFPDDLGKMNRSLLDISGEILLVSQFTLLADVKKGRRPSFTNAAPPEEALKIYNEFYNYLKTYDITVKQGSFGNEMEVELCNHGPVTLIIDSTKDL